jgi:hypothetical protein
VVLALHGLEGFITKYSLSAGIQISLYVKAVMSDNQNNLETHGQHLDVIGP